MVRIPRGTKGVLIVGVLVVAIAASVVGASAVTGSASPSGRTLLNDTRDRYANATSVVGTANVTVRRPGETRSATVRYAVKGNASRVVVRANGSTYRAGTNGTVAWYTDANGTRLWTTPEMQALARNRSSTRVSPEALLNRTRALARNATVSNRGRTTLDGRNAYVVRITPPNATTRPGQATVWIATDSHRLLRVNATDGTNATVVSFPATQFNASIDASTFQPPSDRTVVTTTVTYRTFSAVQTNTTLALPQLNGTFERARVATRPNGVIVAQQYILDGENVTVVSTPIREFNAPANATTVQVDGHDATAVTTHGRSVVFWRANGTTTAVTTTGTIPGTVAAANRTRAPQSA